MNSTEINYFNGIYKRYKPKMIVDSWGYDGWCPICGHNFESQDDTIYLVDKKCLSKKGLKNRNKIKYDINPYYLDGKYRPTKIFVNDSYFCPPSWFKERYIFEDGLHFDSFNLPPDAIKLKCPAEGLADLMLRSAGILDETGSTLQATKCKNLLHL